MALYVEKTDITSNARVKEYPCSLVLQVANAPIFREAGYEPRQRTYDVPPKGKAKDRKRSIDSSRYRAKTAVHDIALCNSFTHFFTWTISPECIDRYDAAAVEKKTVQFLKNASYRKGFSYVIVPELHKDGAIHLHGLCTLGDVKIVRAINPHTAEPITYHGRPVFNMPDWKLGFTTCSPIDENYERACNYVTKYINKSDGKIFGKWYFASRNLVKRPPISLIPYGMDFDEFTNQNPDIPIVPVYCDVRMAIISTPRQQQEVVKLDPW